MSRGDFVRLKEIRKSKGISQLKLAIDLNTNQNTISRYETGEREPGINELIKIADYVIDLGPEGGDFGGEVIACGTPEEVSKNPKSYTGQYLKKYFNEKVGDANITTKDYTKGFDKYVE